MLDSQIWVIDETPDRKKDPSYFAELETELIFHKPNTVKDYAKCLQLPIGVLRNWYQSPRIKKKSKYQKRKELFIKDLFPPTIEQLKAKMENVS